MPDFFSPSRLIPDWTPWEETLASCGLPIYLYGTGDGADKVLRRMQASGYRLPVEGFFVSDAFSRGQTYGGLPVLSLSELEARVPRAAVVLCFGLHGREGFAVLDSLAEKHLVLAPSTSVYGGTCMGKADYLAKAEQLDRVDDWLSDELSRELFRLVLRWKITGEYRWLDGSESDAEKPAAYTAHKETHIDVGAYDGDTVAAYLAANPNVDRILAFEPDESSYRKLKIRTDPERVDCFRCVCSDRDGSVPFSGRHGRGSSASTDRAGGKPVPAWKLDTVCGHRILGKNGKRIGSVKIDAEGMERETLYGAANLITNCRPVLSVAAYHREEDLFELPILMKRFLYDSDLYFRKQLCVPAWDTEFILVPRRKDDRYE